MLFLKKNYGWILVAIIAALPLIPLSKIGLEGGKDDMAILYHISGEFAIRWMTAVLSLTPFYIIFGVSNLFVRQAMGIATAFWSFLHFIIFIAAEGFLEMFSQINYLAAFLAIVILIPLFFTSNRKSMRSLKTNWKKLHSLSYVAILLSLLHIVLLDKAWLVYAIVVGIGLTIRIPMVKNKFIDIRNTRKK